MMRRILFTFTLLAIVAGAFGQEAYNEAIRMAKEVADDTTKPLDERKVATFKKDALFINLFYGSYKMSPKKDRPAIIERFKRVSLAHPRFHDPNKEYVLAYITNAGYITQFSLDTDWVAAYNDIRNRLQK